MPLTETITFKAPLQRGNRIQLPRLVRWQYKMEPNQVLSVTVYSTYSGHEETFLARMTKDGRLTIPKQTLNAFQEDDKNSVVGLVFEVKIIPLKEAE
jgi:hypothetical protein